MKAIIKTIAIVLLVLACAPAFAIEYGAPSLVTRMASAEANIASYPTKSETLYNKTLDGNTCIVPGSSTQNFTTAGLTTNGTVNFNSGTYPVKRVFYFAPNSTTSASATDTSYIPSIAWNSATLVTFTGWTYLNGVSHSAFQKTWGIVYDSGGLVVTGGPASFTLDPADQDYRSRMTMVGSGTNVAIRLQSDGTHVFSVAGCLEFTGTNVPAVPVSGVCP